MRAWVDGGEGGTEGRGGRGEVFGLGAEGVMRRGRLNLGRRRGDAALRDGVGRVDVDLGRATKRGVDGPRRARRAEGQRIRVGIGRARLVRRGVGTSVPGCVLLFFGERVATRDGTRGEGRGENRRRAGGANVDEGGRRDAEVCGLGSSKSSSSFLATPEGWVKRGIRDQHASSDERKGRDETRTCAPPRPSLA